MIQFVEHHSSSTEDCSLSGLWAAFSRPRRQKKETKAQKGGDSDHNRFLYFPVAVALQTHSHLLYSLLTFSLMAFARQILGICNATWMLQLWGYNAHYAALCNNIITFSPVITKMQRLVFFKLFFRNDHVLMLRYVINSNKPLFMFILISIISIKDHVLGFFLHFYAWFFYIITLHCFITT